MMNQTDQTLLEQLRITEFEIENRKALFGFTQLDVDLLVTCKPIIEKKLDALVNEFYRMQTSIPEIALLIGDADTLGRLRSAQRRYVIDLFSGVYDLEYVNNRLRIGLVHKRIGVEPKLYLSAIHSLKGLLRDVILETFKHQDECQDILTALSKLILFDITLVFETYIRSLVSEIESAKNKAEHYACTMEQKVKERTQQLEEMSRTDPLTGLLNFRHMEETVTKVLRSAQRRNEPVSLIYIDVDDFKLINDKQGHLQGDEILRALGAAIKSVARLEDHCFRHGGDEFCIISANCLQEQARELFVGRLNEKLKSTFGDKVSISCGVAQTGPDDYMEASMLIRRAEEKMYTEKKATKLPS